MKGFKFKGLIQEKYNDIHMLHSYLHSIGLAKPNNYSFKETREKNKYTTK